MRRATVAIVGRPNVGKSTLFNRIVGGRPAIVHDRPGSTRDRHFARTDWAGHEFWLVDTGGWSSEGEDTLARAIRQQIDLAIADADVIAFLVDAKQGLHPADQEVAEFLRPLRDRVLLVANKVDDPLAEAPDPSFYELGLGTACPVSASTGRASGDLLDQIVERLPARADEQREGEIQVAVVGRPNVGKSSLVNRLLGAERSVVAPEAGTTRDAVDSPLRYHGTFLNFIDTAGLRKRSKVEDEIEFYSALRTERAVERAEVSVLAVDATDGVRLQDIKIAETAWERGTALIVAVNKWDLVDEKDSQTAERGERSAVQRTPFLAHVPFVYVSALTGLRVRKILDLIIATASARRERVQTAEVNRVLRELVERNQPPQSGGQEIKLLYASQISSAPPVFAVVCSRPDALSESYRRYLANGFRRAWKFEGTPLRLRLTAKRGRS